MDNDGKRIIEFSENNSGGNWWLNKRQYDALLAAGWYYEPTEYDKANGYDTKPFSPDDKRDDVPYAWRHNLRFRAHSMEEAVGNWAGATGEDPDARGCSCCGQPFYFRECM